MKVVYEAALFPGPGGGPLHYVGLAAGLRTEGVSVTHVLPRRSAVADQQVDGEPIRLAAPGNRIIRQATYELSRVALILWWWVSGRRFDAWISRQSLAGVGLFLTRLVARTVLVEINGPLREEILINAQSPRLAQVADRTFSVQLRACHVALPVTPGLGEYALKRRPRVSVHVLANGAHPVETPVRWSDRPRDLVFVGALTPWYELGTVLRAVAMLKAEGRTVTLDVLGDGVHHDELVGLTDELDLNDCVEFHGWADSQRVTEALTTSRVGVLPLLAKNPDLFAVGSPLKLFEYAAAGLRVVGTDTDGISNSPVVSLVEFYAAGDVDGCARAIAAALDTPPSHESADEWSWNSRARELIELVRARQSS